MSSFDPELLRALGDADAALPPMNGTEFSPERLARLTARRARRRLLAALAVTLLLAFGVALGNLRAPTADASATFDAELSALRADLDSLHVQFRQHLALEAGALENASTAAARRSRSSALRCELAEARADGALAMTPTPSLPETRR